MSRNNIHDYKGVKGWDNIEKGILDFNILKSVNRRMFKSVKANFTFYYLLPHLIQSPHAVSYDKTKVIPETDIECEILFHDTYNNAVIHLGIELNSSGNYYIPRTFLIEKITDKNDGKKYINHQQSINVNITNRVIIF